MKAVIISDIHFMNKSKYNPILNEYEGIIFPLANLEYTYKIAEKENCDYVLILGDVIDRSNVSSYLVHKLVTFFKEVKVPTVIVLGNHDISSVDTEYYSFVKVLEELNPNIQVFDETGYLTNDIVCVPYAYRADIVDRDDISDKILLTHIGVSECFVSNSKRIQSDFSLAQLRRFVKVITGHYHFPQEIENVLVVGSPWEIKKDEFEHEEKRVVLYDFDSLTYKSLPSIRKKINTVSVSSVSELNNILHRLENEVLVNPYMVTRILVPFQLSKKYIENVEKKFGSLVTLDFITENEISEDSTVISLKKLEDIDIGKIDLDQMFSDYVLTSVSTDEYEMIQKYIMEVMNNDS